MRLPNQTQRIIGLPLIILGIAVLLVVTDQIFAKRLEIVFVCICIYLGIEVLIFRMQK